MSTNIQSAFVSVVITTKNPDSKVIDFVVQAEQHLSDNFEDYEIVIVDQASNEGDEELRGLLKKICCLRFVKLSSRVGDDVALAAGLENSIGDFVVLMDPRRDPATIVADLVQNCREGVDVIVGVAEQKSTLTYRVVRPFCRFLLRSIDYKLPRNATTLRCLSRRAVNTVAKTGRFHHQLFIRIAKSGLRAEPYVYEQDNRLVKPNTLLDGLRRTAYLVVFSSTKPLRMVSFLGILGCLFAFVIAVYSLAVNLFMRDVVEGWTTQILFTSLMSMLQFTMLAFFGEYFGRLLDERSNHENYDVVFEESSSVFPEDKRINVIDASTEDSAAVS